MKLNTRFRRAISVAAMSAGMLIGGAGLALAATVIGTSITLHPGAGLQTSTVAGNTALLQAYDVDGAAYTTFATLTANNAPTMDLAAGVTIGGNGILDTADIGVSVQAYDAALASLAATGTAADRLVYTTGVNTFAETALSAYVRGLLDDADAAAAQTTLGLVIGTNVQAWDTDLDTWAGKTAPTGTVIGTTDSQGLTNKVLDDATVVFADDGDITKRLAFQLSGVTAGNTRVLTVPDASGTVTVLGNTATGTGSIVLASSPALTTPTLGVATATSVNGLGFSANADGFGIAGGTTSRSFAVTGGDILLTATGATSVTLPTTGTLATLAGSETLTNKTLDVDSNTVSNINGDELDSIAFSAGNYGVPIVLTVPVANTATVSVFSANAPFKFRVVDVWVQETVATNDGTWQLDDGTNNITSATNFQTMDNAYGRVGWIDDAYHTISAGGTLRVQTDGSDSANIMIMIMRVD